jgi:hypothetical protein
VQFIISQDIVATRSGFVVKYNNCLVANLILYSMLKENLKIGQYLHKICTKVIEVHFLTHGVHTKASMYERLNSLNKRS